MKPLLFVSDAHLTRDDPELTSFLEFLARIGPSASTLVIVGDLFNIWFGQRRFTLPHHERVLASLRDLKNAGVRLAYVEGNRDFHLRRSVLGDPFHVVTESSITETHAGWRIRITHGDEVNQEDRQYLAWKSFSKSTLVYGAFSMLPGAWGMKVGERLERKLSGTNIRNKTRFPIERCREYAERVFEQGCHALVMGHFHEERHIPFGQRDGRQLGVWVLPAWRGVHRYLAFEGDGPPRFLTFEG